MVCAGCNTAKDNLDIFEWHAVLVRGNDARATVVAAFIQRIKITPQMAAAPPDGRGPRPGSPTALDHARNWEAANRVAQAAARAAKESDHALQHEPAPDPA